MILEELKCSCILEYGNSTDFERFWKGEWNVGIEVVDDGETTVLTDTERNLTIMGSCVEECFKRWKEAKDKLVITQPQ